MQRFLTEVAFHTEIRKIRSVYSGYCRLHWKEFCPQTFANVHTYLEILILPMKFCKKKEIVVFLPIFTIEEESFTIIFILISEDAKISDWSSFPHRNQKCIFWILSTPLKRILCANVWECAHKSRNTNTSVKNFEKKR